MIRIIGSSLSSEADVLTPSSSLKVALYDPNGMAQGGTYTYDYGANAWTPGATPTDIWCISSAGPKPIEITRLRLSTTQTTAGINTWYLLRRVTPNTGGTFTYELGAQRDTNVPTPQTAIISRYTANATVLSPSVGFIRSAKVLACAPQNVVRDDQYIWDFDDLQTNPIVLRGFGQTIAFNFAGAALPTGLSVNISCTWTEG